MSKPTLLILAAGIGSRYGSLKQLDKLGPHGETIIDYSVYDAIRAGFGKVVFVIRQSIEKEFRETLMPQLSGYIETGYVLQEIDRIPAGTTMHPDRQKPWGTGHAVLMAKDVINEPFAVINADDFYGYDAFRVMADFLHHAQKNEYAMVGYQLQNTLSDYGTVSRGVCVVDKRKHLIDITERTKIGKLGSSIVYLAEDNQAVELDPKNSVSMNYWGFTTDIFPHLETAFHHFIAEHAQSLKDELYIPAVVNQLIKNSNVAVKVLSSDATWFGVTYREDRAYVVEQLNSLIKANIYPEKLWK